MRLPYLENASNRSKQRIINFMGINYGSQTKDGEMASTLNLTTDDFPHISQRKPRAKEATYVSPTTLFSKAGMFVVDGTRLLLNGANVGTVTAGRKQMAAVGDYVLIFPDKKYYNVSSKVFGDMEATYTAKGLVFGEDNDGQSTITTTGNTFPFSVGDGITITGCTVAPENNISAIVRAVNGKELKFYSNSFTKATETGNVTIKREIPDLDFICEDNYRLWGCKDNTIYASKYSDPLNFNVFDGLTSDSYYIQVGSDGAFTGCVPFSSHICFFKEDVLHKLYGSKPSNYQIVTANVFGVQAGCERSLCTINETLYYLGRNGIYAYVGGVPDLASANLGMRRYTDACADTDGEKYYISMRDGESGEWGLYAYDIRRGIWLREDATQAHDMTNIDGKVYFIDSLGGLYRMNADAAEEEEIEWAVEFCPFTEVMNERKGYSKLGIRLELGEEAYLVAETRIDDGNWEQVYMTHNKRAKTINIPILPRRCDNFRVRLSGRGKCTIKSFVRDFYVGSEV